jgi:C4-dicarboxylate transporter, DctM subunit
VTTALIVLVISLALAGAPIFACMAALAILGLMAHTPSVPMDAAFADGLLRVLSNLATGSGAATLATIPLFIFAGYIMAESKTAQRLVRVSQAFVGWIPGGLAIVTILACAIFTTFTGASGVTIVAIGALIMPALLKEGYQPRFALGLVTGTGSVGLLFPPALPLIVYGIVYGMTAQAGSDTGGEELQLVSFSIEKFLVAGIVPGLVLCAILGIYAVITAIRQGVPRSKFDGREAALAMRDALPELLIPILIVVPIVTGKLQPPEAASVMVLYVLLLETLWYKDLRLRDLPRVARHSMGLVGAIYVIIVAATALTHYFIVAGVPEALYAFTSKFIHSKWTFLLALNVLLLIVGCLMDIFSAIVVVVPLMVPAARQFDVDPYHLGVIFLLNLEIGYLTPPVGLNLFITSFRFRKPMMEVYRASWPFLGLMLLALALVTYVPGLVPVKAPASDKEKPTAVGAGTPDGGVAVEITWPDGGVWKPERCEAMEGLDREECKIMFSLWARCNALDELDKLECQDKVLAGEDPFAADAGPEDAPDAAP